MILNNIHKNINEVASHLSNHWVLYSAITFFIISLLCFNITVSFFENYNLRAFNYIDIDDIYHIAIENLSRKQFLLTIIFILFSLIYTAYLVNSNNKNTDSRFIQISTLLIFLTGLIIPLLFLHMKSTQYEDINLMPKHKIVLRNDTIIECSSIIASPSDSVVIFNHTVGSFESLNKANIVRISNIHSRYIIQISDSSKLRNRDSNLILPPKDWTSSNEYKEWINSMPEQCKSHNFEI